MKNNDLRVKKTLKLIDTAFVELLKEQSFQKITVDKICQKAEINRTTFYKYYLDKYDLEDKYISGILAEFTLCFDTSFALAKAENIGDNVYRKIFHEAMKLMVQKKDIYSILWNATLDIDIKQAMKDIVRDNIIDTMTNGHTYKTDNVKYIKLYASMFSSNMITLTHWWFDYYDIISMDEVVELMTSNMDRGLFVSFKDLLS